MSQEACVSDSNRGFESEQGEAGQQVPGSATETALSVTWLGMTNWLRPGAGWVGWRPADSVLPMSSLWVAPWVSSPLSCGWGEELDRLPGSVVREIWQPRSKVMTVRNVIKGRCLEWNLNSKSDTLQ